MTNAPGSVSRCTMQTCLRTLLAAQQSGGWAPPISTSWFWIKRSHIHRQEQMLSFTSTEQQVRTQWLKLLFLEKSLHVDSTSWQKIITEYNLIPKYFKFQTYNLSQCSETWFDKTYTYLTWTYASSLLSALSARDVILKYRWVSINWQVFVPFQVILL